MYAMHITCTAHGIKQYCCAFVAHSAYLLINNKHQCSQKLQIKKKLYNAVYNAYKLAYKYPHKTTHAVHLQAIAFWATVKKRVD